MKVLVACEFSGIVRDAFAARGHDAWSCDLLPSESPGQHHQGDILDFGWTAGPWDLLVAHPPCTYLAAMGIWWNAKRPERWPMTHEAMKFVDDVYNIPSTRTAIENPVGYLNKHWKKPSQVIHPWQFGHEASKPGCLWLFGLPLLRPTQVVGKGKFYVKANGSRMAAWSHKCSGTRKADRARIASRTFTGIARAMAEQWG